MDLSWYRIQTDCESLASKIRASGKDYESMLCITRGGGFIGSFLSELLNYRKIRTISLQYYNRQKRGEAVLELVPPEIATLRGNVILVDDLIDSGKTMKFVIDKYSYLANFDVAVLYDKGGGSIRPQYFVDKVSADEWITFPWETSGD